MGRIIVYTFSGILLILVLSIYLSLYAAPQSAGSTTASFTGVVADEQGKVITNASVTVRNLQTNITRQLYTDSTGTFLFTQLLPGYHEIIVQADGFATQTTRLELLLGSTIVFNFTMQVGRVDNIVEVNTSTLINLGKTESSTNIDRQRIDDLPINRRNFLDFALTAPRVTLDRLPPFGSTATSGLSFNGQTARNNNITIDGVTNNDNFSGGVRTTFSQDAVQEFQIVSDNYSAEFGRASGGIINIVTRSGSNNLRGNLFCFIRNDELSAREVFTTNRPPYDQYQFGATLSGPIKKDRAFFFASFERLSINQNI
ncbi:MAG: TonB-dependent receptor, partial [Acidobacteriota bacterium]